MENFLTVTELAGDEVSKEQVERLCNRYYWAAEYCREKRVLEAACGTALGARYLENIAATYYAGDYSADVLAIAKAHFGRRIQFQLFDAQALPYGDDSLDRVLLFEAIYYLPSAERFIAECRRVLRNGGQVLLSTANKDLYDFNPSPHSFMYYGVVELKELFNKYGFKCDFFGGTPVDRVSLRQKLLRPIKKAAVSMGVMPRTMAGKKLLKRLVFGNLVVMPAEIGPDTCEYVEPAPIASDRPDRFHKVIYCLAHLP